MNIAHFIITEALKSLREQGHKPTERTMTILFDTAPGVHHCTSHREGDFIIWRCPLCKDYERRFNWRTGQMTCTGKDDGTIHTGTSSDKSNMEALTLNTHPN